MPAKNKEVKEAMHNPEAEIKLPHRSRAKKVWMIIAIALLILLIAESIFGYYKWQQYRKLTGNLGAQINDLNNQVKSLNNQNVDLQSQLKNTQSQVTVKPTDAQSITKVATIHFEAVNGEVIAKTFKLSDPKFSSSNKNFAIVYYTPLENGQPGPGGGFVILKKVNGDWTIVAEGQQLTNEDKQKFGIPNDLISG